ncbi:aminodeoxychorismate lyase [Cognatiluteimonas telluris]|jgi:4-amino-4-deoxychorismate lyase|uniref:aminodeoxychorismate lyase n=1 Tax=Cognatiluteimonas telluris TaxID=1104775 RepID=UPI00140D8DF1|nr:aminodeoxychorismate lyase [Lysobacter telluris]
MKPLVFDGAIRIESWPADARTIAYGDGLFETMRAHRGTLPWWSRHWQRLADGARRLHMPLPEAASVRAAAATLFDDGGDGVLKLLVGRGASGRGYAPALDAAPLWMLSRHPVPQAHPAAGLHVRWCDTRLALQPALARIKHCNRLEQVLASAECRDAGVDEGLMCDGEGTVVGATTGNLFLFDGGRWVTPLVDRCGVAGICRAHLVALLDATEQRLSVAQVEQAEALLVCNAVRGILPVARLGDQTWPVHPAIAAARQLLAGAHPGFAIDPGQQTEHP